MKPGYKAGASSLESLHENDHQSMKILFNPALFTAKAPETNQLPWVFYIPSSTPNTTNSLGGAHETLQKLSHCNVALFLGCGGSWEWAEWSWLSVKEGYLKNCIIGNRKNFHPSTCYPWGFSFTPTAQMQNLPGQTPIPTVVLLHRRVLRRLVAWIRQQFGDRLGVGYKWR